MKILSLSGVLKRMKQQTDTDLDEKNTHIFLYVNKHDNMFM